MGFQSRLKDSQYGRSGVVIGSPLTTTSVESINAGATTRSFHALRRGPQQMTFGKYKDLMARQASCCSQKAALFGRLIILLRTNKFQGWTFFRCLPMAFVACVWASAESKAVALTHPIQSVDFDPLPPRVRANSTEQNCQGTHQLDSTTDFLSHSVTEFAETT